MEGCAAIQKTLDLEFYPLPPKKTLSFERARLHRLRKNAGIFVSAFRPELLFHRTGPDFALLAAFLARQTHYRLGTTALARAVAAYAADSVPRRRDGTSSPPVHAREAWSAAILRSA